MEARPQHPAKSDPPGPSDLASWDVAPCDVAFWDVAPGDTVVVRGAFTRAEVRAYVDLVERLYPHAGLTVIFLPPGVGLERAARMAEAWRERSDGAG